MKKIPTPIDGAFLIEAERRGDERGYFSRLFCDRLFEQWGLETSCHQVNTSLSNEKGTLRGMHYQLPPHAESKLVCCTAGALYDQILDLRPDSPTYKQSFGVTLTPEKGAMLYLPKGCAHGFLTLQEHTSALYFVSAHYCPEAERGVRYDDPHFTMKWPVSPAILSEKDQNHPPFSEEAHHANFLQRC